MFFHLGEKLVEHDEPARIVRGYAELADEASHLVLLEPGEERLQPLHADVGRGAVGVVGALVRARVVAVEILMSFIEQVVSRIVQQQIAVDLGPRVGAAVAVAANRDRVSHVDAADRVDGGLGGGRPEALRPVRLVHDAVGEDRRFVAVVLGQAAPEVGKGGMGNFGRADKLSPIASIIVHVQQQRHFALAGQLDDGVEA